jgi:hypothetical protein
LLIGLSTTQVQAITFDEIDKDELASILFKEIQRLDSSGIRMRNTHKAIDWNRFKSVMVTKIKSAKSFKDLAKAFDDIQQGFTNSHSSFQIYPSIYDSRQLYENPIDKRGFSLGYTYPKVNFFSVKTKKYIENMNGFSLKARFKKFEQFECQYVHQEACLKKFTKRVGWGLIGLNIKDKNEFTATNGATWTEVLNSKTPIQVQGTMCAIYASDHPAWELSYSSGNICLLKNNITYILKVNSFQAWGTEQDDFRCNNDAEINSMCYDVQKLRDLLSLNSSIKLIVDLQGNRGGAENTPFLSLLSTNPFFDNLVVFNNTKELNNPNFRFNIFYGLDSAERWYKSLTGGDKSKDKKSLPKRSDFCRGDVAACAYKEIQPSSPKLSIQQLLLVVDSGCFSSCDDLVWRLKHYSNAYVLGQPPASDSTYATVSGIIYMTKSKELKVFIKASGQKYSLEEGSTKLAWFTVPYTSTVDEFEHFVDGDFSVIDKIIPVTINNFENINKENVLNVINYSKSLNNSLL